MSWLSLTVCSFAGSVGRRELLGAGLGLQRYPSSPVVAVPHPPGAGHPVGGSWMAGAKVTLNVTILASRGVWMPPRHLWGCSELPSGCISCWACEQGCPRDTPVLRVFASTNLIFATHWHVLESLISVLFSCGRFFTSLPWWLPPCSQPSHSFLPTRPTRVFFVPHYSFSAAFQDVWLWQGLQPTDIFLSWFLSAESSRSFSLCLHWCWSDSTSIC